MSHKFRGERVYVVVWPQESIVKAGYTSTRRWRTFVLRGAVLHRLVWFANYLLALGYEQVLHDHLTSVAPLAFTSGSAAEPYLGPRGDGWRETYRLPDLAMLQALPEPVPEQCLQGPHKADTTAQPLCLEHCHRASGGAMPEAMHVLNERTNLRTGLLTSVDLSPNATRARNPA